MLCSSRRSPKKIIKRSLLILTPISILCIYLVRELQTYWTITIISCICVLIILWNIPRISLLIHQRPKYPEDLVLSPIYDEKTRYRFHRLYQLIMNVCLAILTVGYTNYLYYRVPHNQPLIFTLGVLGGVLYLYFRILDTLGQAILALLCIYRNWQHDETNIPPLEPLESDESLTLELAAFSSSPISLDRNQSFVK